MSAWAAARWIFAGVNPVSVMPALTIALFNKSHPVLVLSLRVSRRLASMMVRNDNFLLQMGIVYLEE